MSDRKWLRDWGDFEWSEILMKMLANEADGVKGDIGITKEEMEDYLKWLSIYEKKLYEQVLYTHMFKKMGLDDETAAYLAEHIDALVIFLQDSDE